MEDVAPPEDNTILRAAAADCDVYDADVAPAEDAMVSRAAAADDNTNDHAAGG